MTSLSQRYMRHIPVSDRKYCAQIFTFSLIKPSVNVRSLDTKIFMDTVYGIRKHLKIWSIFIQKWRRFCNWSQFRTETEYLIGLYLAGLFFNRPYGQKSNHFWTVLTGPLDKNFSGGCQIKDFLLWNGHYNPFILNKLHQKTQIPV